MSIGGLGSLHSVADPRFGDLLKFTISELPCTRNHSSVNIITIRGHRWQKEESEISSRRQSRSSHGATSTGPPDVRAARHRRDARGGAPTSTSAPAPSSSSSRGTSASGGGPGHLRLSPQTSSPPLGTARRQVAGPRRARVTSLADEEQRELLGAVAADGDEGEEVEAEAARWRDPPVAAARHVDGTTAQPAAADAAAASGSGRQLPKHGVSESGDIVAKSALASGLFALFLSEVEAASVSRAVSRLVTPRMGAPLLRAVGRVAGGLLRPLFQGGAAIVLLRGPAGLGVALIIAVAGIAAAIRAQLKALGETAACCMKCDGWGATRCDLCGGRGEVLWEGKHYHRDPCPACFGAGFQKCDSCCGACCTREGTPPFMRPV